MGYFSWKHKRPFISRIFYEVSALRYVSNIARFPKSISKNLYNRGNFAAIGDYRHQYFEALRKYVSFDAVQNFDLEPLKALRDMLLDPQFTDRYGDGKGLIGGAPQLLKIYPFMRTIEFGVYWPTRKDGKLFLKDVSRFFRTFALAERRPARAQAVVLSCT